MYVCVCVQPNQSIPEQTTKQQHQQQQRPVQLHVAWRGFDWLDPVHGLHARKKALEGHKAALALTFS